METYAIFRDLAIILISAKLCGLLAAKLKAPQVVGEIIAGLLHLPQRSWPGAADGAHQRYGGDRRCSPDVFAGLETSLHDLKRTGFKAFSSPAPVFLFRWQEAMFCIPATMALRPNGSPEFYSAIFTGVIMTATSVSISVASLQELGYLKSKPEPRS